MLPGCGFHVRLHEIQIFDRLLAPARVTMLHNGVLVHLDEEIRGETRHLALPEYRRQIERGPVVLHGHNCPVRFRNIWVRPLPPPAGADPVAPPGAAG